MMKQQTRRVFLRRTAGSLAGWGIASSIFGEQTTHAASATKPASFPLRAVTCGPGHHFFGYYDKTPWDKTGRYLLGMEVDFMGRDPRPGESITVGMIDLRREDRFIPLDKTAAWSWQQGTMLQWLGTAPDREIIYNSIENNRYAGVIRDVHSGKTRRLPRPIYEVSLDGSQALTLDFERVNRLRPGYGYVALPERHSDDPAPKDAGIYHMDLRTGEHRQILSVAWAAGNQPLPEFEGCHHWFNHLKFNPSGTRFIFLHRWRPLDSNRFRTRLYTARTDGTEVRLLSNKTTVSHFDWRDDETILIWMSTPEHGARFYHLSDRTGQTQVVGEGVLKQDGHCLYSPDRRWILVDTYPDKQQQQRLMLYRPSDQRCFELGAFAVTSGMAGSWRCDLHSRWNRDGTAVCFDSTHEQSRQMYVMDVSALTHSG